MFGVEIAVMSILALGGAGIYLGLKTLENYSPGRRKVQKDLAQLKKELVPLTAGLVPFSYEEMEQLSYNVANRSAKKGVVKTVKGVFTTVYHEPLIAWCYRKYVSSKENTLVYVRTKSLELVYRTKKAETEVVVNEQLVGTIDSSGALRTKRSKGPLAKIVRKPGELYLPVIINGREVGGLTNRAMSKQPNPRAYQLITKMSDEEKLLFVVLATHEMVASSI